MHLHAVGQLNLPVMLSHAPQWAAQIFVGPLADINPCGTKGVCQGWKGAVEYLYCIKNGISCVDVLGAQSEAGE